MTLSLIVCVLCDPQSHVLFSHMGCVCACVSRWPELTPSYLREPCMLLGDEIRVDPVQESMSPNLCAIPPVLYYYYYYHTLDEPGHKAAHLQPRIPKGHKPWADSKASSDMQGDKRVPPRLRPRLISVLTPKKEAAIPLPPSRLESHLCSGSAAWRRSPCPWRLRSAERGTHRAEQQLDTDRAHAQSQPEVPRAGSWTAARLEPARFAHASGIAHAPWLQEAPSAVCEPAGNAHASSPGMRGGVWTVASPKH